VAAAAMVLASFAARADAITMSATYYTISETDPDMNHLASGTFNNEVQNTLGTDGLPILNTAAFGCSSGCFTNSPLPTDLTASGEITWWSPGLNANVTQTGTGTITTPYSNGSFFPPNGTGPNNFSGFQAAVFSTELDVPTSESISFSIGADDVAFVYLDGSIVCDLGGVHGNSAGTCTSSTLTAGDHSLELFYADIENTAAALTFDVTTEGVTGAPTPLPGALPLFAGGLGFVGLVTRRRKRKIAAIAA
jgi:fibro-slime domain-containing protein